MLDYCTEKYLAGVAVASDIVNIAKILATVVDI